MLTGAVFGGLGVASVRGWLRGFGSSFRLITAVALRG